MCTFRCVHPGCNATWNVAEAPSVSCSHGLCPQHSRPIFLEIYRKQQRKEGVSDCAGRVHGIYSNKSCTYYTVCVNEHPTWADYLEVDNRQVPRRTALYGRHGGLRHSEVMAMAAG